MTLPIKRLPEEMVILGEIRDITGEFPKYSLIDYEVFNSRKEYFKYLKKTLQEEKEKRGITE